MNASLICPIGELLKTGAAGRTWKIGNFSNLGDGKYFSEVFVIGGCKWKLMAALCGPKRDFIDVTPGYLDLYLCIADSPTQQGKWSVVAEFSLGVVDQTSKETDKANKKDSFTAHGGIFSLPYPIPLRTLHCPEKGYLVNDTCVVEVGITVRKVVGYITYPDDSKEEASLGSDGCQSTVEKKNAYHAVLRCLHQEGEHTWKKEALLAELRVALEISSSDHNMYLKRVLCGGLPNLNLIGQ